MSLVRSFGVSIFSFGVLLSASSAAWALNQPIGAPSYATTPTAEVRLPFTQAPGGALTNPAMSAALAGVELAPPPVTRGAGPGLERVFEARCRSVVYVIAAQGEGTDQKFGTGTGAVVTPEGHILTAAHVIEGAEQIAVGIFPDCNPGTKPDIFEARLHRVDQVADLALLKLAKVPKSLSIMPLGSLSSVRTGSQVVIIGHPQSLLMSMSTGVVSAIRPNFAFSEGGKQRATVIQTDGALNPGNSGGPMMTPKGELIGVNSFILGKASAGLNFAVSINDVRTMLSRSTDRYVASAPAPAPTKASASDTSSCKEKFKVMKEWTEEGAKHSLIDIGCAGRANAMLVEPQGGGAKPYMLVDRNGDGKGDVKYHLDASGSVLYSEWDDDFDGTIDYRGEHASGGFEVMKKTRVAG